MYHCPLLNKTFEETRTGKGKKINTFERASVDVYKRQL